MEAKSFGVQMPTDRERIAALEALVPAFRTDVAEIKADVKTLLAAHNRQTGAAKLAAVIWGGLLALGGAIGGIFAARGH
jgi:cytochrome c-type biogenesis protein CcmH/NrfG